MFSVSLVFNKRQAENGFWEGMKNTGTFRRKRSFPKTISVVLFSLLNSMHCFHAIAKYFFRKVRGQGGQKGRMRARGVKVRDCWGEFPAALRERAAEAGLN